MTGERNHIGVGGGASIYKDSSLAKLTRSPAREEKLRVINKQLNS